MQFEHHILAELSMLRAENLSHVKTCLRDHLVYGELPELTDDIKQKLPTDVKVAFCGNCLYNDKIKTFHETNFYPFCECYFKGSFKLVRCKIGETSDQGKPIINRVDEIGGYMYKSRCPPGYRIVEDHLLNIMIFEDSSIFKGKKEDEILSSTIELYEKIKKRYRAELFYLENLYVGYESWISNTIRGKTLHRYLCRNRIKSYVDHIETIEHMYRRIFKVESQEGKETKNVLMSTWKKL